VALYRDQIARLSLPAIRARFPPRVFSVLKVVKLEHLGLAAEVELVRVPAPGLPSGWRSAMRCPRCRRDVEVVGCIPPGHRIEPGWACSGCSGWRGRPRRGGVGQSQKPPSANQCAPIGGGADPSTA
jgi:hypothetical protein